jgi:hypothetical protein
MLEFEGTLNEFALSELLAMMVSSSVTGVLEVGGMPGGRIFCRDGRLYHAETESQAGVAALRALPAQYDAPFRFSAHVEHPDETLHVDSRRLVGLVERDEQLWARTRQSIPSLDWVPELCHNSAASVRIDLASWRVITAVDGWRSVAEIAAQIGREPQEVGAEVGELVKRQLARLSPPRSWEPPSPPAAQPATFFDRLLSGQLGSRRKREGRAPFMLWWLARASY